jgi:hypothetical protein
MIVTAVGPYAVQCVGREIRLCHTITVDGVTVDVCRALTPQQALDLARRLMIEVSTAYE